MPVNPGIEFQLAQEEYEKAVTDEEKLRALNNMLTKAPTHKGAETLRKEIKTKIAKLKLKLKKEKSQKKGRSLSIKKEGAARVCIIGLTNTGKSTLLSKITNAKPEIAEYEYTTKKPEIGVMDYNGIKIQIIEIPAIFRGFAESSKGPTYLSLIKTSELIVVLIKDKMELEIIEHELEEGFAENVKKIVIENFNEIDKIKEMIWCELGLIYTYTKQPGKGKDYPPVALKKGSCVLNLAEIIHKDFVKKFKFARLWGKSVKHQGSNVGLEHILEEGDIVELHLK